MYYFFNFIIILYNMKKWVRILLLIAIISLVSIGCCILVNILGLDNMAKLQSIVNNGFIGALIYITLLILQVVFIPINSLMLIVPAILLFGSGKAFLLSMIALVIGSSISYYLGKLFGLPLISWIAGKEHAKKYQEKLGQNGKYLLPIFLLIPIFPDEIMCMLSGATKINFWYFLVVIIITRAIDLASTCFIGAIIPFRGWWLLLWAGILIGAVLLTAYITKHHDKLSHKIETLFIKRQNKENYTTQSNNNK